MTRRYLLILGLIVFYCSCSSDTVIQDGSIFSTSLSFSRTATPALIGGGRFFGQQDTGVWYDATFSYSVKNTSTTDHSFRYKLEIGLFKDGHFIASDGKLGYDKDSVFSGDVSSTIYGKSTGTVTITRTVGLARRDNDWTVPFGYRLTITDVQSNESTVFDGFFEGNTANNRYHGVIYTVEQSPDPLGYFDGPDDGDWEHQNGDILVADPANPNPFSQSTTASFAVQESASVILSVNRTAADTIFISPLGVLSPGYHKVALDFSAIPSGTYRLFMTATSGSKTSTSRGDLMVKH